MFSRSLGYTHVQIPSLHAQSHKCCPSIVRIIEPVVGMNCSHNNKITKALYWSCKWVSSISWSYLLDVEFPIDPKKASSGFSHWWKIDKPNRLLFFEGKSIPNVPVSSPSEQTWEKLGAEVCNAFVVSHVRNKLRCVAISYNDELNITVDRIKLV